MDLELVPGDAIANNKAFQRRIRCPDEDESTHNARSRLVEEYECRGVIIHDANIVATALTKNVPRIVTEKPADFTRFTDPVAVVPLNAIGREM